MGPLSNSLYLSDAPVDGLRTEFTTLVRCSGRLWIASMLSAMEYLVEALVWLADGSSRLTSAVFCWLNRVG